MGVVGVNFILFEFLEIPLAVNPDTIDEWSVSGDAGEIYFTSNLNNWRFYFTSRAEEAAYRSSNENTKI